jgi:hypothetical protein
MKQPNRFLIGTIFLVSQIAFGAIIYGIVWLIFHVRFI